MLTHYKQGNFEKTNLLKHAACFLFLKQSNEKFIIMHSVPKYQKECWQFSYYIRTRCFMWSEYRCYLIWTSCLHTNPILKDSLGTFYKRMLVARYMYFVQGLTLWPTGQCVLATWLMVHVAVYTCMLILVPSSRPSSTLLICYPEVNGFFPSKGHN